MSKLFESILSKDKLIGKLTRYYEGLGLYVDCKAYGDDVVLNVADNPDLEHYYGDDSHTGMFIAFQPFEDGWRANWNTVSVKKEDRGRGLGGKLIDGFVNVFGPSLVEVVGDDMSGTKIWDHYEKKYPHIKWNIK
jgi:hypothetical protein